MTTTINGVEIEHPPSLEIRVRGRLVEIGREPIPIHWGGLMQQCANLGPLDNLRQQLANRAGDESLRNAAAQGYQIPIVSSHLWDLFGL